MEKPQHGQIDKGKLSDKQAFDEKLHFENETADCRPRNNILKMENVVIVENKDRLSEIKNADQSTNSNDSGLGEISTPNFHEVSSINLSDVYSNEKFGQELLQFIEHGHSLENWHHSSYQDTSTESFRDTSTESFSPHMQMESVPIEHCIDANIQPTSESTVTLTALNSTSADEAQPISFCYSQPSTYESNNVDHDYCIYPRSGYSVMENYHGSEDNGALMQPEQYEMGMDQEKLQRMKRRKEKNRECSRQFRLKQKGKEQGLTKGKMEKVRELENLKRNVETLKSTLRKVAQQCSGKCPKTRMLLSHYVIDKENINPGYMQIMK